VDRVRSGRFGLTLFVKEARRGFREGHARA
jgi:hypothetical protein